MAGAIRTGVQNAAYSEGWDRVFGHREDVWKKMNERWEAAFHHPDSEDIEAAVGGYTDADDEAPDEYDRKRQEENRREVVEETADELMRAIEEHTAWHDSHPGEQCISEADVIYEDPPTCERCHRTDLKPGQECACSARSNQMHYSCKRCGRALEAVVGTGELCSICEAHLPRRARR